MNRFIRKLITEWRALNLPFADETFVVAVSGGADSVSLTLALNELKERQKLNLRFVIAHFNHNLRQAESELDAQFVREIANKFNFELAYGILNSEFRIQNQAGNLEQNARIARYEFLTETAQHLNAYAVLTAHTLNDQAETFLLNLIRGSGLEGLSAMKSQRDLEFNIYDSESVKESKIENPKSKILLVRPLLNWAKREDTENFCRLNKIEFRHDAMNDDLTFKRVRIRKILIPLLQDFNPKIIETLAKTSELLKDSAEQLADINQQSAENFSSEGRELKSEAEIKNLNLKDLRDVFPAIRRTILRDWLRDNRGNLRRLEMKHIEAIEKLIFSRKSGKIVELPGGELILKKGGKLYFQKTKVEKSQSANYNQSLGFEKPAQPHSENNG
jgi:tRNA(Ile)-lysidine synthase